MSEIRHNLIVTYISNKEIIKRELGTCSYEYDEKTGFITFGI